MNDALIPVVLLVLSLSVAINLLLTFRLFAVVRRIPLSSDNARQLEQGDVLPAFAGETLLDKQQVTIDSLEPLPTVVVFVAPGCPKCKSKLPEISQMTEAMEQAGVRLWLVGLGRRWQVKRFLKASGLMPWTMLLTDQDKKNLNPSGASPFYLFLDEQRVLQASGLLGDENWQIFVEQMREIAA